jgi:hypothetical protein
MNSQAQVEKFYHYTSLEGFLAIVRNRKLRASDLLYLNDPREVNLGSNKLGEFLNGLGYPPSSPQQGHLLALRKQYREMKDDFSMFCISTSKVRDALPQWLEYAERGRGICLGFGSAPFGLESALLQRSVAYSPQDFLARLETEFEESQAEWLKLSATVESHDQSEGLLFHTVLAMLAVCGSYKHSSWSHEEEVRFIFFSYNFGEAEKSTYKLTADMIGKIGGAKLEFRVSEGVIIPFVDIPIKNYMTVSGDDDPIPLFVLDEVIVGPNCKSSRNAIGAALNEFGFHVSSISDSECSIR